MSWVFIPFLLFSWASPAWAVLYKWKDEKGQHFTDDITKVPQKYRPFHTNEKAPPKKKTEKPKVSVNKNPHKKRTKQNQKVPQSTQPFPQDMNPEMEQMAEELIKGLEQSMEQMAEEMGKAFEDIAPAIGN
ncbi:MAG: DUF4124 domain-containing protein [Nitrospina sp.]|nr:DUF4124 domain-containing protein [Nitrospina sp.]MBT5632134.1 DUF4124 domain-containing protein [Nitrospina sp.]